jgi:uncharacterized protein (TIGR03382 family)
MIVKWPADHDGSRIAGFRERPMRRLVIAALMSIATIARADLVPPNVVGCRDKAPGAACQLPEGGDGTCQTSTCTRHDYSQGIPPRSVPYDCLLCKPAPAAPAPAPAKSAEAVVPAPQPVSETSSRCDTSATAGVFALTAAALFRRRSSLASPTRSLR